MHAAGQWWCASVPTERALLCTLPLCNPQAGSPAGEQLAALHLELRGAREREAAAVARAAAGEAEAARLGQELGAAEGRAAVLAAARDQLQVKVRGSAGAVGAQS